MNDSLILNGFTSLPERYKRGEIRIHMHARSSLEDYCAIFKHYESGAAHVGDAGHRIAPMSIGECARFSPNDLEQPMLVSVVKLLQEIESVAPAISCQSMAVPALVWLQPLDACLMLRANAMNHGASTSKVHSFKVWDQQTPSLPRSQLLSPTDEEDRELADICRCFAIQQYELIHKTIKSRAEVVGNFTDVDAPIRVWLAAYANAIRIFSRRDVELRPDELIIGITPEGLLEQVETLDLTFCTPYLEARAIERMDHG